MSAPFTFNLGAGFSSGVQAGSAAAATSAASNSNHAASSAIVPPCRPNAFPSNLLSPSLPPCPLLHAQPALHPLRGRVLTATKAFQPGECVLHEHAFICSNWDEFRCADCDKPHPTRSCVSAKKKWSKKVLARLDRVEGSLQEADCIGELDHARSFIKLLQMYLADSVLGASAAGTSALADFFALSYTHYDEALAGLTKKLPYQNASVKDVLDDAGIWPSGLSLEQAATMLAILNTNSHELSDIRGTGIFLRASLMEHSCAPNCNFSTTGRELQILALRPIAAGENLSIDYGMGMYRPVAERRKNLLKSHGFVCFCTACTSMPDKARAFTCVNPQCKQGVVFPVGIDNREKEMKQWEQLVNEASRNQPQTPSPLPMQPFSPAYPQPLYQSWSCNTCQTKMNPDQIKQCLEREKQARKKLKSYRDEDENDEEAAQFNFDKSSQNTAKSRANKAGDRSMHDEEDEEDEEEEEDDMDDQEDTGDEIVSPQSLISTLVAQAAPSLHPSHHTFFWALEFYARLASADEEFASDAIPIFQQLISQIQGYIAPLSQLHDSLMIYTDYLAQVYVVTGAIDKARATFEQARQYCCLLNSPGHHSSVDLKNLVDDTPNSAEELQMKYQQFQQAMEALIYDTQVEAKKKKKGNNKKKKKSAAQKAAAARTGVPVDSEEEEEDDDDDEAGVDIAVTQANQLQLMQQMEAMMLEKKAEKDSQGKDDEGDAWMDGPASAPAKNKKKNNKKKK